MSNLAKLKAAADEKHAAFLATIATHFPGRAAADWYRAVAAIRGENVRRNDDTREDAALDACAPIREAHDAYIEAIHAFYRARDGEGGFLGSRGL